MTRYLFRLLKFIHGLNPFKKAFCQVLKKLNVAKDKVYTDINFYGKFNVKLGKKNSFYIILEILYQNILFGMDYSILGKMIQVGYG